MKKRITIIFLILHTLMYCQKVIKVTYATISLPKISYDGADISKSMKDEIESQLSQKSKQPKKFVLYYDDGNSFFQSDPNDNLSYGKQKIEYYRLKNKDGIYILNDFKVGEFYGYYPMDNVDIEYVNETQTIDNFKCKLALYKIGNAVSKVWYSEDIPISAGPYNYYKLPGLVLKIESPNFLCYAINISKIIDEKGMKKMDNHLKVYEGEELNLKIAEGRSRMTGYNREKFDQMKQTLQNK